MSSTRIYGQLSISFAYVMQVSEIQLIAVPGRNIQRMLHVVCVYCDDPVIDGKCSFHKIHKAFTK